MPVFEVVTSEIILSKYHIEADTEDEAISVLPKKGTLISQKVTWPDIEQIDIVS